MACFRSLSNCFLLVLALWVAGTSPAWAAIDKAGAEKLKTVVEKAIADWASYMAGNGNELKLDGPVMVEPNGTYYAVTLPGVKFGDMDGAKVEMGMIAINAMPAATPGQWKMTIALPTPFSHFDEEQRLIALTTIGAQNLAGIWHEDMGSFTKLTASYQNVVAMDPEHKPFLTIKNITMNSDMKEDAQGLWSGPFRMDVNGMAVEAPDGAKGSIESISGVSNIKGYSIKALNDYRAKITALNESYEAGEGEDVSMNHVLGIYNLISEFMGTGWDGFDVLFDVKGVALSMPSREGKPARQFALKNSAFGFGMDGISNDSVTLNIKMSYDGLQIVPAPVADDKTLPDKMNIDLSLNKLPFKALMGLGQQSLQMTASAPQEGVAKLAMLQALMTAPQLLTQSQTNLTIRNTFIGNPLYNVALDAAVLADLKAQMSATGTATLKIRGMDMLVDAIKTKMDNPTTPAEAKARMQKTLETMTIMQIASTKQNDTDGNTVHVYNFELGADGKILLNGTDMSALLNR